MKAPISPDTQPSPVAVLEELKGKGYTADLRPVEGGRIECRDPKIDVPAQALTIDEVRRFEGASNPGDNSIILAVSVEGTKGALMLAYGPAASKRDADVLELLDI